MNEKLNYLLKYFNAEEGDYEIKQIDKDTYQINDDTYLVYTDEEADEAHCEYIKNLIEDFGLTAFAEHCVKYIFENCLTNTEWFDTCKTESYQSYIDDIREESSDNEKYATRLEEEMADAGCDDEDKYLEYLNSNYPDSIEWYRDNFGDECFNKVCLENCGLDFQKISDFCISEDGRGHSLSSYNGIEVELDNGYFAYKI